MIRRKKLTIFTDAKDTTTVLELKKMIEGKYFYHCTAVQQCSFIGVGIGTNPDNFCHVDIDGREFKHTTYLG